MKPEASFRPYASTDRGACLKLFDANCPEFFAPNERDDYESFLFNAPDEYEVCELDGSIVAAFGLIPDDEPNRRLVWIMLDPRSHGFGIGSSIMKHVISLAGEAQSSLIGIAASHKSAPFFARYGATVTLHTKDGWGPGMDRVDMELVL